MYRGGRPGELSKSVSGRAGLSFLTVAQRTLRAALCSAGLNNACPKFRACILWARRWLRCFPRTTGRTASLSPGTRQNPEKICSPISTVGPGYFPALRIHVLAGRNFPDTDTEYSAKVAIVSESCASHYFGKQPAVGQRIGMGTDPGAPTDIEIVGVVNNTKYESLQEQSPRQIFVPAAQAYAGNATVYVHRTKPAECGSEHS